MKRIDDICNEAEMLLEEDLKTKKKKKRKKSAVHGNIRKETK
jgi:hypothetical protein